MTTHPASSSEGPDGEIEPPGDEEGDEVLADHPLDLAAGSEADLVAQRQDIEGDLLAHDTWDPQVPEADAIDQAVVVAPDEGDERRA